MLARLISSRASVVVGVGTLLMAASLRAVNVSHRLHSVKTPPGGGEPYADRGGPDALREQREVRAARARGLRDRRRRRAAHQAGPAARGAARARRARRAPLPEARAVDRRGLRRRVAARGVPAETARGIGRRRSGLEPLPPLLNSRQSGRRGPSM